MSVSVGSVSAAQQIFLGVRFLKKSQPVYPALPRDIIISELLKLVVQIFHGVLSIGKC